MRQLALAQRMSRCADPLSSRVCRPPNDLTTDQAGTACVRRAGVVYGWGLRQLVLVVPILVCLLHPVAGLLAAVLVVVVLVVLGRFDQRACPGSSCPRRSGNTCPCSSARNGRRR